jgi:hypothetical protein
VDYLKVRMKSTKRKSEIAESLSSKLHELIDSFSIVKGKSINKAVNDAAKVLAKQISKKLKNLNTAATSEIEDLKSNVKSSLEKMSESQILAPKPARKVRTTKPKVAAVAKTATKVSASVEAPAKIRKTRTPKAKTTVVKSPIVAAETSSEISKPVETPTVKTKATSPVKKVAVTAKSTPVAKKKVVAKSSAPKAKTVKAPAVSKVKTNVATIVKSLASAQDVKTAPETEVKIEAKPVERVKRAWVRKTPIVTTDKPKVAPLFKNNAKGVLVASTSDKPGRPYTPRKKKTESPK